MGKVHITPKAQKDLKKIPKKEIIKIKRGFRLLEKNPHAGKKLSNKLKNFLSLRAWPYRIIYFIDNNEVWVVNIRHRKDVYKK